MIILKKRKTYEISVIDKTYSKIISDETKFYTSDTALELAFELKETEYKFESAEIVLLNIDDRSLVTRPVAKVLDSFTYELDDDITAHYGDWRGQLRFEQAGEIYVSSPVKFRIENDLSNDRPPQMTEVNSWKNLRAIADGLIADIRSELELVAAKVSEIDGIESQRQQAEQERVSAELIRVENENQRVLNYENIQETIDSIGKVKLVNLVKNGNFAEGLTGINPINGTRDKLSIENGSLRVDSLTNEIDLGFYFRMETLNKSNKYYISVDLELFSNLAQVIYVRGAVPKVVSLLSGKAINGKISGIASPSIDLESFYVTLYGDKGNEPYHYHIKSIQVIDLTTIFGVGNEPSKQSMDWIINNNTYFKELSVKRDDIQQYEINQLRKAVIALGGTI